MWTNYLTKGGNAWVFNIWDQVYYPLQKCFSWWEDGDLSLSDDNFTFRCERRKNEAEPVI